MPHISRIFYSIVIVFFLFLWISIQFNKKHAEPKINKLTLVCTTGMIADIVQNIAEDTVKLHCLMGPGVDPHLYRPTQGDMHILSQADIILYNGLHLEGKMTDLLAHMQCKKSTYAVAEAIDKQYLLSTYSDTVYDPHIWHDVQLWIQVATYIRDILLQHNPVHAKLYQNNAKKYLATLQKLHTYVTLEIQKISEKQRILVTAHDAFRYFGKSYGIRVVGLQGTSTDSEVSIRDIQELADFIVEYGIKAIFIESSVSHRSIQAVQQAVYSRGWKIKIGPALHSDALASNKNEATYCNMIQHNVDAIVSALQ